MSINIVLELMQRLPTASFALVLFMAILAGILVSQILRIGFYATLVSIPALLVAGLFGNAILLANNIMLSPDKASNTALSATFGFVMFATMCLGAMRLWHLIRDRR